MSKFKKEFHERAASNTTNNAKKSVYDTLIYTVFQKPHEKEDSGMVVALTSANPNEGVTYITRNLSHELAKCEVNSVARINSRFLRKLYEPSVEVLHRSLSQSDNNICEIGLMDASLLMPEGEGRWDGSWQYRRDYIGLLRNEFDYALIDCSSLRESGDVLSVAPFVDGVILVIEADRTYRDQILRAERAIETAQGKLLGHVLNKRTYTIPDWIYRKL
jgi:Mrp family chromosome partitioning ATPase